ncbi:MAG: hypothetical protein ACMUJM_24265 [bacterium]
MEEIKEIKAIEMVRRIRDKQAQILKGKTHNEIIEFFKKAGDTARKESRWRLSDKSKAKQCS